MDKVFRDPIRMTQGSRSLCWLMLVCCGCFLIAHTEASQCLGVPIGPCDCDEVADQLEIDCSFRELKTIQNIPAEYQSSIFSLDYSTNLLNEFPVLDDYAQLTTLDLSLNLLNGDNLPAGSLPSLRILRIDNNQIQSVSYIRTLLERFPGLETLSASSNPIASFSSNVMANILEAPELRSLDLSKCKLTKVMGQHVIKGLPKLVNLDLSGNPLRSISDIISTSLTTLDLSNTKLSFIQSNAFHNLPALTELNLSRNYRLTLRRKEEEIVHSDSLQTLDLSFCNMDTIEISGFPQLRTVILRGNLINALRKEHFAKNTALEMVDLSSNAITHISVTSFQGLVQLKNLDLSFNMIRYIDRDTFQLNELLTHINLSRNFIERFSRISSYSLTHLNMSWCEVLKIDLDAFNDMPGLVVLDLSNNLFDEFPETLRSPVLQSLDLSMCRLSYIRKTTLHGFPELTQLKLAGNRFTTPFRVEYFEDNVYLREIWLGDNPWRCDCNDPALLAIFSYIYHSPPKLQDLSHLRCTSPESAFGLTWDKACANYWFAPSPQTEVATTQRVWMFIMVSLIVFSVAICFFMSIRRWIETRRAVRTEEERVRNTEEAREIMRRNRSILEQEAQLNAPDPRETRPPCYEDAILLPKFAGSFASLGGKFKMEDYDDVDSSIARRNRSRSEEVLSHRESSADPNRPTRRQIIEEANHRITVHPVPEIPARSNAIELQPIHAIVRPTSIPPFRRNSDTDSDIIIIEADCHMEEFDGTQPSPYARRRVEPTSSFRRVASGELEIIDDHYSVGVGSVDSTDGGVSVDSLSLFTVLK